ncbi:hypothetical protein RI129_010083 [Pyrocoelia pectoralis]|uniref:Mab-21-like HhH/H2TH-like domain-containing protein n=1 Tax=Pyrocoelia pectoralis TaxID=417401 RepID=A0AAN7VAK4_9COLE
MNTKNRKGENVGPKISSKGLKEIEELILPASKLRFCSEQLQNLNYIFNKKLDGGYDPEYSKAVLLAKSVTERLIQRLLCGVGLLDSRFASKFLVSLQDDSIVSEELDYIVRLDSLSTPTLHQKDQVPKYTIIEGNEENRLASYAQIRLHQPCCKDWQDFINPKGYLRRDKVQAKVVELLSVAASTDVPNSPLAVDESLLCGSPGKVMDALTLHQILRIPSEEHVFYGPSGNTPRFPNPRDFKLAIVDDPSGIRIRVGFHSPALSSITIDVRLLVGIGFDAWPSTSNFPLRIPLGHSDCLLYYKAAQTGLYLVGYGVQSNAWQIRLPAAECTLEKNYHPNSTVKKIIMTLSSVLLEINEDHRRYQISHRILNTYSLRSALLFHLEKDLSTPTKLILNWSPKYLSTHVLIILDNLVKVLRKQKQSNYFFPNANLLVNPGHLCEDDYVIESNRIKVIMLRFFDESLMSLRQNPNFNRFIINQKIEMTLLSKWKDLIDSLTPPPSTRGRRICFAGSKLSRDVVFTQYTTRQLEYIGIVLKHLLMVRQSILLVGDELDWVKHLELLDLQEDSVEDIIYILVTLIEQARDKYLDCLQVSASIELDKAKLKRQIDNSASKLVEQVRKEREVTSVEYVDDITLVKIILKWLYKGLDYKKYLAPILRPYLSIIFLTSHGASWHLEAIRNEEFDNEIKTLGVFAKLVNAGTITPAEGLVDAVGKKWNWAKSMLKTLEAENLRLIFISERRKSSRHILVLPSSFQVPNRSGLHYSQNQMGLLSKNSPNPILMKLTGGKSDAGDGSFQPPHWVLKNLSPLNLTIKQSWRMGEYRCLGDIFDTIKAMKKLNILQEVSALLPYEDRLETLEAIQKLTNEKAKQTFNKKKCNAFVQLSNSKRKMNSELLLESQQKYTPKEESAGIREVSTIDSTSMSEEKRLTKVDRLGIEKTFKSDKGFDGTLIGSCRAARIREDTSILQFEDYFKIQSLQKRSSFKY